MIRSILPSTDIVFLQQYVRNIPAMIGAGLLVIIVLMAIFAP